MRHTEREIQARELSQCATQLLRSAGATFDDSNDRPFCETKTLRRKGDDARKAQFTREWTQYLQASHNVWD